MVRDAYYFLVPLLLVAVAGYLLGWMVLSALGLLAAGFVAFFFRDPQRRIPADPGAIVSPADGKIVQVQRQGENSRISIFLSIFDVHVNRAPIAGVLTRQRYQPGKFLLAFDERASVENERLELTLSGEEEVQFSLIAGLVARRIVPWRKEGDSLRRGDRIALIRFGSRVDIVIPSRFRLRVGRGDRVRGGSTILACRD